MENLKEIIGRGESVHLEAKSGKGGFPDSLWETYSAFANTDGGTILLGVEEDQNHKLFIKNGLSDSRKMKDTFWNLVNNRQKISHNIVLEKNVYVAQIDGKEILVVDVPRAERTARPVYKGSDPRTGSYKRFADGDHLCSVEEVGAMMRDASISPLDASPVKELDLSALNAETINGYRQLFRTANPNHLWNQLDNEIFLRRIKAVDAADDGLFHPTEAGLLMFGYEYEITRRFPLYFLDYQEDREVVGITKWKDRIVSSSGDWSGNVFDFILKVLAKLQSDLKVPFVVKGVQRIDDTPLHRLLREAATNCLVHADYYGRQGIVISKSKDGFVFANPGNLRISQSEAIAGGVSDPRNATLLKMFSLIRFGERAGSGLNGIMQVWSKVYHTMPVITEKTDADRVILTLSTNGKEPDMDAMLEFYDDEMLLDTDEQATNIETGDKIGDKSAINYKTGDKSAINSKTGDKLSDKSAINKEKIVEYITLNPNAKSKDIASYINLGISRTKDYLAQLTEDGIIAPQGANRNRTYSVIIKDADR